MFEDYFITYFVPSVEQYLASKGMPFKVELGEEPEDSLYYICETCMGKDSL